MNDYQEERHSSNKLVVKVANENPESMALIPSFKEGIDKLDEINKKVEEIRTLQEQDISAVKSEKDFTMEKLSNLTIDIAGAVYSYAEKKNDVTLKGKVDYKPGKMGGLTPGEIISAANTTLAEAKKILPADLAKEGISAAELADYEEMVVHFRAISDSPRKAIIEKAGYTKQLTALFKQSTNLFKNSLDRLSHQFLSKDIKFYYIYRGARKAVHHGPDKPDKPDVPAK